MQARLAHERGDALRRFEGHWRDVLAVVDGEISLAVGLICGDGAPRHGADDTFADFS